MNGWRRGWPAWEHERRAVPRPGWSAAFALFGVAILVLGAVALQRRSPISRAAPAATSAPSVVASAAAAERLAIDIGFTQEAHVLETVLAHTPMPATTTPPPRLTPMVRPSVGSRPLRILVVGDSVGVSFARGLEEWARHGNVQVLDDARFWCSLGRKLPITQGLTAHLPGSGCDWTKRWTDAVRDFDPDVTFVLFSIWEISPRRVPGYAGWLHPGQAPLDAWQLSEYQAGADTLSARGAPVVWFTIPCEQEPTAPGTPLWFVNHHTIRRLGATRSAVHVVDLDHAICAHGPMHSFGGVAQPRPDGAHYSQAGALAVSNWVMPIVLGHVPNPKVVG